MPFGHVRSRGKLVHYVTISVPDYVLPDVSCYTFKPVRQQLRRKSNTCTTCTSTSTTSNNTSSISSTRCEYVDLHYVIPQLPTFV